MWSVVAMLLTCALLLVLCMIWSEIRHARQDRSALEATLREAEQALDEALREHPEDFDLHATLRRTVLRVRKQL